MAWRFLSIKYTNMIPFDFIRDIFSIVSILSEESNLNLALTVVIFNLSKSKRACLSVCH